MNRAERRMAGVKKKDPMISIKQSDIDRMKEEATAKGCKAAFALMLLIPARIVHDKFGLLMKKDHRLDKFVDMCMDEYKRYEEGYVAIEELAQMLKEETGIVIKAE